MDDSSFRRLVAAVAGAVAVVAGIARLRRRRTPSSAVETQPSPADELRARLDEARASSEAEATEEPSAEEPAAAEAAQPELDARREVVHERARQAIDELR